LICRDGHVKSHGLFLLQVVPCTSRKMSSGQAIVSQATESAVLSYQHKHSAKLCSPTLLKAGAEEDDDDEEEFVYPGTTNTTQQLMDDDDDEEEFVYPGLQQDVTRDTLLVRQPPRRPSPAQLESLYAAASTGDLNLLKKLFKNALDAGEVEPFSLANEASARTGFTALHTAASRGYLDIVTWCKFD
jgi:hypothetical protein